MTPKLLAAAGLAAAAVIAITAVSSIGPAPGPGVGGPSIAPSSSPAASPPAASASVAASPDAISSAIFKPTLSVVVPAGWTAADDVRTFRLIPPQTASAGRGEIGVMAGPFVRFEDPECEDQPPAGVGTTAAQVIETLRADPRLVTTAPEAVTVGGQSGQMLDLRVADDWTGTCGWSDGKPAVLIVSATDTGPAFGTAGPARDRYLFLEVEDSVVVIDIGTPEGSDFEAFLAEAMPIVETMRFAE